MNWDHAVYGLCGAAIALLAADAPGASLGVLSIALVVSVSTRGMDNE